MVRFLIQIGKEYFSLGVFTDRAEGVFNLSGSFDVHDLFILAMGRALAERVKYGKPWLETRDIWQYVVEGSLGEIAELVLKVQEIPNRSHQDMLMFFEGVQFFTLLEEGNYEELIGRLETYLTAQKLTGKRK